MDNNNVLDSNNVSNVNDEAYSMAKSYSSYMVTDPVDSLAELDDEVEGLQKLMDELYTTLVTVQELEDDVLVTRIQMFRDKARELRSVYSQIDVIYEAVSKVSTNLQQLEICAEEIDKQIDDGPLKKMFGFFKSQHDRPPPKEIVIPPIFDTDQIFAVPEPP